MESTYDEELRCEYCQHLPDEHKHSEDQSGDSFDQREICGCYHCFIP